MSAGNAARSQPPDGPDATEALPSDLADVEIYAIWNALTSVYDPELYIDVVSLGLVYDVRREGSVLVVEMTLTTPGCPVSESLPEMAKATVAAVVGEGVTVDVRVVWDPPWSPEMMDAAAMTSLGFRTG